MVTLAGKIVWLFYSPAKGLTSPLFQGILPQLTYQRWSINMRIVEGLLRNASQFSHSPTRVSTKQLNKSTNQQMANRQTIFKKPTSKNSERIPNFAAKKIACV